MDNLVVNSELILGKEIHTNKHSEDEVSESDSEEGHREEEGGHRECFLLLFNEISTQC